MRLRYYQRDALNNVVRAIRRGHSRNLVVIGVGGGKTPCIAALANYCTQTWKPNTKVLCLAHREELTTQNAEQLGKINPALKIGFEANVQKCPPDADVMMASIHSVGPKGLARIRNWTPLNQISAIIIDEAHHIPGSTLYHNVINEITAENPDVAITGFTGTPKRPDGATIDKFLPNVAYGISMPELIGAGYLVPIRAHRILTQSNLSKFKKDKSDDFNEKTLAKELDNRERNLLVPQIYLTKHKGEKALVFAINKEHATHIASILTEAGIKNCVITEDTPKEERKSLKSRIYSNEVDVVVSVSCLAEGFNVPEIKVLFFLRPTRSAILLEQFIGRATRPIAYPNPNDPTLEWTIDWVQKPYAVIYDFVDIAAAEAGVLTVAKHAGLADNFALNGEDVYAIKRKLDATLENYPELANALSQQLSLEEIDRLICSTDLLADLQSLRYPDDSNLTWLPNGQDSYALTLESGENVTTKRDEIGRYVLQIPPLAKREPTIPSPQTIPLEANDLSSARQEAEHYLQSNLPQDYSFSRKDAPWRQRAASQAPSDAQLRAIKFLQIPVSEENLTELNKLTASQLISSARYQIAKLASENRMNFGQYKGTPIPLIRICHPEYFDYLLTQKRPSLEKYQILAAVENALSANPLPWFKQYRPKLYAEHFEPYLKSHEADFEKDPQILFKTLKNTFDAWDPTRPWELAKDLAQKYKQRHSRSA